MKKICAYVRYALLDSQPYVNVWSKGLRKRYCIFLEMNFIAPSHTIKLCVLYLYIYYNVLCGMWFSHTGSH